MNILLPDSSWTLFWLFAYYFLSSEESAPRFQGSVLAPRLSWGPDVRGHPLGLLFSCVDFGPRHASLAPPDSGSAAGPGCLLSALSSISTHSAWLGLTLKISQGESTQSTVPLNFRGHISNLLGVSTDALLTRVEVRTRLLRSSAWRGSHSTSTLPSRNPLHKSVS